MLATKKTYTKRTHKDIDTGSHPTSSTTPTNHHHHNHTQLWQVSGLRLRTRSGRRALVDRRTRRCHQLRLVELGVIILAHNTTTITRTIQPHNIQQSAHQSDNHHDTLDLGSLGVSGGGWWRLGASNTNPRYPPPCTKVPSQTADKFYI